MVAGEPSFGEGHGLVAEMAEEVPAATGADARNLVDSGQAVSRQAMMPALRTHSSIFAILKGAQDERRFAAASLRTSVCGRERAARRAASQRARTRAPS